MNVLTNALAIAASELRRNLGRALLTALGVLIGVGAVITMVGIGEGATASIEEDLSSIGRNMLILNPGTGRGQLRTQAPPFDLRDADAIAARVPYVELTAPTTTVPVLAAYGGEEVLTKVYGAPNAWFAIMDRDVAQGRLPTEAEQRSGAGVCVIGETVRQSLFGGENAVGARIRVADTSCQVIGVIAAKGANTMGIDEDDVMVAPLTTVQRRIVGSTDVTGIFLSVDAPEHIEEAKAQTLALMRERRHIGPRGSDDFSITDTREVATMVSGITSLLTAFLGAVAGVSLLVGGIGIMNIMLVSVTERTREIGIRMSVGALEGDVLTQFLVEAGLISTLGGIAGVATGLLGGFVGARALGVIFTVNAPVTLGAVAFSALVGVVFGFYPARRAAHMEPIDALRHH